MFTRISSLLALIALAACGAQSPPPPGDTVDCAIGAGADFSPDCTLEQITGTPQIVIHHPDGGFRRFARDPATGALASRDGAEALVPQAGEGGAVQFAVGGDRYRFPPEILSPAPR